MDLAISYSNSSALERKKKKEVTNPQFNIRPAVIPDYEPLCKLIKIVDQLHAGHYPDRFTIPENKPIRSIDMIRGLIEGTESEIFIAETNNLLSGFIIIFMSETADFPILVQRQYAIIDNIGVYPELRNQGIGSALIKKAETWAKNKDAGNIELNAYLFNTKAIDLYQNLGYKPIMIRMSKSTE